jgi:GTP pyrophosphokinase
MDRYAAQGRDFDQIYDLVAVRVLVEDIRSCYEALGLIHSLWHPIRGAFDDYIANPRENMYQSLHTSVLGPDMTPFEVQIRTYRMHEIAEFGVAAHWRYKEGGRSDERFDEQMTWMRQLLQWHKEEPGAEDFLESVKTDIFPDQVFVYTPKGQVRELPAGATPIDFAYSIHTDLGHNCAGAKVNGKMVSLDYQLQNGDTIEILARPGKGPSLDWLNLDLGYAKTANARGKIRHWFRRQERVVNIERGRDLLERELRRLHVNLAEEAVAKLFNQPVDDFLVSLGSGALSPHQLAPKLLPPAPEPPTIPLTSHTIPTQDGSMTVQGMAGLAVHLAHCCGPVVGDPVQGFITRSRGVTVHRKDCRNLRYVTQTERLVDVEWGTPAQFYEAKIAIEAWDRVGLLRDITTLVSAEKVNIAAVNSTHHKGGTVIEQLTLHTRDAGQLSRLLSRLEAVRGVIHVERQG